MFDHVSIGVADIAHSKKFYDAALSRLVSAASATARPRWATARKPFWLGAVGNRCAWCARPRRSRRHSGGRVARAFAFVVVERGDDGHGDGVRFRRAGFHRT